MSDIKTYTYTKLNRYGEEVTYQKRYVPTGNKQGRPRIDQQELEERKNSVKLIRKVKKDFKESLPKLTQEQIKLIDQLIEQFKLKNV